MLDETPFDQALIDLGAIRALIAREIADFAMQFARIPVPEHQDLRGQFLTWLAVFVPEAWDGELRTQLADLILECRADDEFPIRGWWKLPAIDAAMFRLTLDSAWLDACIANLDHHRSGLRLGVMHGLALVAPWIRFDEDAIRRIIRNLEVRHFYCEDLVALFAVSDSAAGVDKRSTINAFIELDPHDDDIKATLRTLSSGEAISNPFLEQLSRIQHYATVRLLSERGGENSSTRPHRVQTRDEPSWQHRFMWTSQQERTVGATSKGQRRWKAVRNVIPGQQTLFEDTLYASVLWNRIGKHPLMAAVVQLPADKK